MVCCSLQNSVSQLHSNSDLQNISLFIHSPICQTYSTLSVGLFSLFVPLNNLVQCAALHKEFTVSHIMLTRAATILSPR